MVQNICQHVTAPGVFHEGGSALVTVPVDADNGVLMPDPEDDSGALPAVVPEAIDGIVDDAYGGTDQPVHGQYDRADEYG